MLSAADDQGKMSNHEYVRGLLLRMVQIIVDHPRAVEVEADYIDECTTFIVTVNSSSPWCNGPNFGMAVCVV